MKEYATRGYFRSTINIFLSYHNILVLIFVYYSHIQDYGKSRRIALAGDTHALNCFNCSGSRKLNGRPLINLLYRHN